MRNLATVQRISDIQPIPGADSIIVASVLGWKVVIRKGEFEVGDLCVYCEIDSIMPDRPEFEFLRERKFKIKTIKLRGQVSQGICFPMGILPGCKNGYRIDTDVTELLGVTKYEPEEPSTGGQRDKYVFPSWFPVWLRRLLVKRMPGLAKIIVRLLPHTTTAKTWPGFFPKTDETRVQVLQNVLDTYKGQTFHYTEKLDGCSASYYKHKGKFGVCSRKLDLKSRDNVWWQVAENYNLAKLVPDGYVLQGEILGPKIQGNKYGLSESQVFFYNVWDILNQQYLSPGGGREFVNNLGLPSVPYGRTIALPDNVDDIIELSRFRSALNDKVPCEGIVLRPTNESINLDFRAKLPGGRISFKAINPDFLLKYGV